MSFNLTYSGISDKVTGICFHIYAWPANITEYLGWLPHWEKDSASAHGMKEKVLYQNMWRHEELLYFVCTRAVQKLFLPKRCETLVPSLHNILTTSGKSTICSRGSV